MRRVIPLFLVLILGTFFGLVLTNYAPQERIQTIKVLPDLHYKPVGLSAPVTLQMPKPAIINVFASWCIPCAAEMPSLIELQKAGVPIIGLAYKDRPDNLKLFLERHNNPYTSVIHDDGSIAAQLGITGVPENFLIDQQGQIVRHKAGALDSHDLADWQQEIATWH